MRYPIAPSAALASRGDAAPDPGDDHPACSLHHPPLTTHPTPHVLTKSCAPGSDWLQRWPPRSINGSVSSSCFFQTKIATCIFFHHAHPQLFFWYLANMGRHEVQPDDLWEKTIAKGYKQGAHRTEDSKRDSSDRTTELLILLLTFRT